MPKNEREKALSEFTKLARTMADEGRRVLGPALCASVFEFTAKAIEERARIDGQWRPEEAEKYRAASQDALDILCPRWRARKAAEKPQ